MTKKVLVALAGLIVFGFAIYWFAWPYDHMIRFEAPTYPGVVRQILPTWSDGLNSAGGPSETPVAQSSMKPAAGRFLNLDQTLTLGQDNTELRLHWSIEELADSTSRVKVRVTQPGKRFINRLAIPFAQTESERQSAAIVRDFYARLREHLDSFRVRVEEVEELASTYTAYVSVGCRQYEKAAFMMREYPLLTNLMVTHDIQTNGLPFLEITRWDEETDSIYFNFCYPIVRSEKLPIGTEIKYKRFFGGRALKATYNGNYIFSDRAWYALRKEAERRGLEYENKPVEFFYNNPNMGDDAIKWKAEIFLPLKEKQ